MSFDIKLWKKEYYQKNKEIIKEKTKEYKKKHINKYKEYLKEYRKKHCIEAKEYAMKYYKKRADKLKKKAHEYYQNHLKEAKKRQKIYYKNNIERIKKRDKKYRQTSNGKSACIRHTLKRRLLKRNLQLRGTHTIEQWLEKLKASHGICACCKKRVGIKKLTKDHIKPIGHPEATDSIDNLQPLCQPCNSSKRNLWDGMRW